MKKIFTLVFVLSLLFSLNTFAQLLLEENFDYPAGDTLLNHGWNITGTSTVNPVTVASPGLSYVGYPSSGIGNAALLTTTGQDVNKQYTDSVTSGSVYASFMVNVTSAQTPGDYFLHLGVNPTNTFDFFARTFVRLAANGNLTFGISKSSTTSNPAAYSDSIYTTGTTYLLVVKYALNDGLANDTINLFINPAISGTEPAPNLTVATTQTDAVSLGTVNLRQGSSSNAANVIVDGIRVSTFWSDIVPVELVSFNASANGSEVNLAWTTATELNNSGFSIERKSASNKWESIGFVKGNGTTTAANNYSFTDKNILSQTVYSYRLKQLDFDGSYSYSKVVQVSTNLISTFELKQNYPNPFNPSTQISFSLVQNGFVRLVVYNLLGQEVKTLINRNMEAGSHSITFDASDLQSGVYLYKLNAAGSTLTKKMILLR
ncbi:MAG: hypothetical protein A2315_17385 [Ignavibacteria bacterium RIFOXYB2_FULL_35_12]|nr:MAG: hypothetical protein A2006_08650 [Ignavibacteria bacterium GWC2_35_8]OGU61606.1 MAG: hypothetical protein A2X60_06565 [Ignavibacteria bacterium GWF2_35_20]OGU88069.1 MAG: hypothetical protein A3K31_16435 [Ignavibacteria bacterium RIFOXYA12_FULL_35_25]OGU93096.1 MAG: hypothetical protein A2347_07820 [Ignavibacteria bacterium RIFOXYB12_FULL_35_14]OGU98255.1 MAG: hypothetical protein A2455_15545 [Ignavibacteria bacterium RIFOXYC2_FULL_35_16]OGV03390.1 MAG: hypothetical protein A2315_17385